MVNMFEQVYEIVNIVNCDNVGFVFDSFYFYVMGLNIESLKQVDGKKIFIYYIDDIEDFFIGFLMDEDCVWLG